MLMLAFDTSTRFGSIGLGDDGGLVAEAALPLGPAHSGTLLPEIDRLLSMHDRTIADVEAIVVGAGPGSYTGVRISASVAKGLCYALGVPLFAYSSLASVVAGLPVVGRICVAMDAGAERIYAATYHALEAMRQETAPEATEIEMLLDRLDPLDEWTFAGDGAAKHGDLISERGGRLLTPSQASPRAAGLLWLARKAPGGRVAAPDVWEPEYGKPPAAVPYAARQGSGAASATARGPSLEESAG